MYHITHEAKKKVELWSEDIGELWSEDIGELCGSLEALHAAPRVCLKEQLKE